MRLPVRFVFAAAAMLLSSCWWVGPPFYTGNPADAGPVRPGVYKADILGDGKPAHAYRVAWQPDGSVLVTPLPQDDLPAGRLGARDLDVVHGSTVLSERGFHRCGYPTPHDGSPRARRSHRLGSHRFSGRALRRRAAALGVNGLAPAYRAGFVR